MPLALITGPNRGLGLAFVEAYLARGWRVIAATRTLDTADRLAELERAHPDRLERRFLDLADFASIDRLADGLKDAAIDLLLSNGALTGGPIGAFGETDYTRFELALRTNTMAPFRLAERLADPVARSAHRTMFFLSSRLGAHPFFGYVGYMTSKTALNQVVKQVSLALMNRGVIAVAAHPGWVATNATAEQGTAPLTPTQSAAMLMAIIDRLRLDDSGKFFDPDGSELPLVTQQAEPRFYGKPKGALR